ncbi:MAG: acyl-CoA dehydrogenase family protein [Pseudomonadales bacterium]
MHLHLSSAEVDFLADVRAFIDRHWPPAARRPRALSGGSESPGSPADTAWFAALAARGWSVPDWPREHGGTGWSVAQRYLWARETALAEAPRLDPCGVDLVGPLLCALGSDWHRQVVLPTIREARARCCFAAAEPEAGSDLCRIATRAVPTATGYRLDGVKCWVAGAARARWMLCLARTSDEPEDPEQGLSLFLVDMTLPGLRLTPTAMLDGAADVATVTLEGVSLPEAALIGGAGRGLEELARLDRGLGAGGMLSWRLRAQAERLKTLARETADGSGLLLDDADFGRKLATVEIALAALEGLELRALGEATAAQRARGASSNAPNVSPRMAPLLKILRAQAGQRLGELFVEALGYYGLPFPDALLIDNEGSIGHDYALSEIMGMLRGRSWSIDGGTTESHKNRIARTVLGF